MKRLSPILFLVLLLASLGWAQTPEPRPEPVKQAIAKIRPAPYWPVMFQAIAVKVREVDGSPSTSAVTELIFPNGSLTRSGQKMTVTFGGGGGDVVGPAGATDEAVARFDTATGKLLQNSAVTISDTGSTTITSATSTCFTVGPNGATDPTFQAACNTAGAATGINVKSRQAGQGADILTTSSAANENLRVSAKGTGAVYFTGTAGTGTPVVIGPSALAPGSGGTNVLVIGNGTAPAAIADASQLVELDSAAGDSNLFVTNEAGEQNRLSGLGARNSAQFDVTSSTTLTNITGLTRNVEASRVYKFQTNLQTTANVAGGIKFSIGGTATATAISYEGMLQAAAAVVAQTRATALGTTVCASTTTTAGTCHIEGVIQVNAAGTLTVQFAQNASNGSASSVLANQYLQLTPIN